MILMVCDNLNGVAQVDWNAPKAGDHYLITFSWTSSATTPRSSCPLSHGHAP